MSTDPSGTPRPPIKPARGEAIRLHVGGTQPRAGWKIINSQPGPTVDYVGVATDLSLFADASVTEIYASHVYEHLDYMIEFPKAMDEAKRVLIPGGLIRIGVPDMEALARLLLTPGLDVQSKADLMRRIYGGHVDEWDYHYSGYTFDLLGQYLFEAGFVNIRRVERFGLFDDTTDAMFLGRRISLNVQAMKPG
jgi:predicted SAM-dependent methyltransferase